MAVGDEEPLGVELGVGVNEASVQQTVDFIVRSLGRAGEESLGRIRQSFAGAGEQIGRSLGRDVTDAFENELEHIRGMSPRLGENLGEGIAQGVRRHTADVFQDSVFRNVQQEGVEGGQRLVRGVQTGMGPGLSRARGLIDDVLTPSPAAHEGVRRLGREIDDAVTVNPRARQGLGGVAESLNTMTAAAARVDAPLDELEQDLTSLARRSQALRQELSSRGISDNLFAVYDDAIRKSLQLQERFERERVELIRNPAARKELELQAKHNNQILRTETQNASRILEAYHGERVADTQRAGALELAAFKANSQRLIIAEQQRSRARIEIFRFTVRQIQFFERQIANALGGVAGLAGRGLGAVASAVGRLGGIFRRGNTEINEGLKGALIQRETSISRSFGRQTREIRTELTKQSQVIERFQAQTSTGVVGAVTGRSQLGALLGGGVAIGGGFALFQGLRNGIKIGGDFVQGLAVLQAQLGLTAEEMANVRQQSIDLGNDITLPGVSALDAAQAIQILGKQFASLGDAALPAAQSAAKGVLQLSRAAGVQAEEAARVVGAAVNIFGVDATKATEIADQVTNALTNAAGVGFNDFADSFTQAASVFNLFVGPAEDATKATAEFNAAIAVLAKGGLIGSDAGTSLKQFFLQANRGTVQTEETMEALIARAGETGTAFFDASGKARTFTETVDILRRGVAGLTDQARTRVFQKLFGSDAARAGAILVDLGGNFDELVTKVQKLGAAEEIAAAQNTGLRGALDALRSVIETQQIKTYEKYQGVLAKVVLSFTDLLNAFFEGQGVFRVIRGALFGLAAGLGALLAAKAAAEAIQLLTTALFGLSSPLGVVVTGIAIVAAAIGALSAVSPEFRSEVVKIGDALKDAFTGAASPVADRLAQIVSFIRTKFLPAFVEFSIVAIRQVLPALRRFGAAALRFIVPVLDRIGDAFNRTKELAHGFALGLAGEGVTSTGLFGFAERLGDNVRGLGIAVQGFFDALRGQELQAFDDRQGDQRRKIVIFAEQIGSALHGAFVKAKEFFEGLQPLIQPAIDGFRSISDAVRDLFSGGIDLDIREVPDFAKRFLPDRTSIAEGIKDFVAGIAKSLGNIGLALIGVITPALRGVLDFIGDFFGANAKSVAGRAGRAAQAFLIGPFQNAATALGKFLGSLASDPRLLDALVKLAALAALTAVNFLKGFVSGVAKNAPALMNKAAELIDTAFNGALKRAFAHPFDFLKIFAAVLGGFQLFRLFQNAGRDAGKGFIGGLGTAISTSFNTNKDFFLGFFGGRSGIRASAEKLRVETQAALRNTFDRLNRDLQAFGEIGALPTGIGPTPTGQVFITQEDVDEQVKRLQKINSTLGETRAAGALAAAQVRNGFQGLSDRFDDIGAAFGSKGVAIGTTLGVGIVSGVSAALAGQQLGRADSLGGAAIGLAGIISSALLPVFTLSAAGAPEVGAVLGGVTLTIGLLTAAWTANKRAAEEAAAKVDTYTDILVRYNDVASATTDLATQITNQLRKESPNVQDLLLKAGFNVVDFTNDVTSGQSSVARSLRELAGSLGVSSTAINGFIAQEDRQGRVGKQLIDDFDNAVGAGATLQKAFGDARVNVDDFISILRVLFDEAGGIQGAISEDAFVKGIGGGAKEATDAVRDTTEAFSAQGDVMSAMQRQQQDYLNFLSRAATGHNDLSASADRFEERRLQRADEIRQAIDLLNQERTDRINEQIAATESALQGARDAADAALQAVLDLVNTPFDTDLGRSVDQLILDVEGVGQSLQEQLGQGVDINAVINEEIPTEAGAEVRRILKPFRDEFQRAVAAAITENPDITPEALREKFQPVFDQIVSGKISIDVEVPEFDAEGNQIGVTTEVQQINLPPAAQQALTDILNGILNNPQLAMGLEKIKISNQAIIDLQKQLDALHAQLDVEIHFSEDQIREALRKLGFSPEGSLDLKFFFGPKPTPNPNVLRAEQDRTGAEARDAANRVAAEEQRIATALENLANQPPQTVSVAIPNVNFNVDQTPFTGRVGTPNQNILFAEKSRTDFEARLLKVQQQTAKTLADIEKKNAAPFPNAIPNFNFSPNVFVKPQSFATATTFTPTIIKVEDQRSRTDAINTAKSQERAAKALEDLANKPAPTRNAIPNVDFNVTQNIYETNSALSTAGEAVRALRLAASGAGTITTTLTNTTKLNTTIFAGQ